MEQAYQYLLSKINYGDSVVVAVSGGPDSMALLSLLIRMKKGLDIEVICAHVNHNVRKESSEEKIFVQKYCAANKVVFESMTIEEYGDDNFHNEARNKRYNYFNEIVNKYHAKYLLTAHHADDLMETILMRIVRGSTLRGYSGFSKELAKDNYTILRPLIGVTKAEILTYNKNNKIKYVQDLSNEKDVYTRNRFRKYIIPEIRKEDANVHEKFYKFSKTLLDYNNYIDKEVRKILKRVYPDKILNLEEFKKEDEVIQTKILYYILESFYQDDLMLITDNHVQLLNEAINSRKANITIHLPNNIKAVKSYDTLILTYYVQSDVEYEIELIDFVNLPNQKNIEMVTSSKLDNNDICRLSKDEVKFPLHVRTRRDGDKMQVKGMLGHKKINDIFVDEKIKTSDRDLWPIVVDSNENIVWLPGLKKSKFDRTKDEKYDIILKYY